MQGKIKKVISGKGFGFIANEDSDRDIFFHSSNLKGIGFDELTEGMTVEFDIQKTEKGNEAINVSVVN